MKNILVFGDSNTFGTKPMPHLLAEERFDEKTRWPSRLGHLLGEEWHIIEEGLPGRTTVHDDPIEGKNRNGSRMLEALIESHRPIDLLIISLGTNDHKFRFSLSPIDIAFGVGRLIDLAKSTGHVREILVLSPPHALERGCFAKLFEGAQAKSPEIAKHIELYAIARKVKFLDLAKWISSDPLDGIHLSAKSHEILATKLAELIKKNFP